MSDFGEALASCREELYSTQSRLKLEEEDFQQRQKALIHSYTAEINSLKSQMALLKSQCLGMCVAMSPMRLAMHGRSLSPIRICKAVTRACGSPMRQKREVGDVSASNLDISIRLDFVRLMKDFEQELIQQVCSLFINIYIYIYCLLILSY